MCVCVCVCLLLFFLNKPMSVSPPCDHPTYIVGWWYNSIHECTSVLPVLNLTTCCTATHFYLHQAYLIHRLTFVKEYYTTLYCFYDTDHDIFSTANGSIRHFPIFPIIHYSRVLGRNGARYARALIQINADPKWTPKIQIASTW